MYMGLSSAMLMMAFLLTGLRAAGLGLAPPATPGLSMI